MERLVRVALHDTGGEAVEGAFVDRWESNASRAVDALEEIFTARGFTDADAAVIREAVGDPAARADAAVVLLVALGRWTRPLVEALLEDPLPSARAIAVRVGSHLLDPVFLLRPLRDPDPQVRAAAVRELATHRQRVPGGRTLLAHALNDGDAGVRAAAAATGSFYDDPAAAEALVQRVNAETDPRARNSIIAAVARKTRAEGTHVEPVALAKRIGAPVRAMLLRELHNDDPKVREMVARALERLRGEDVAGSMLDRLTVEEHPTVRATLLLFNGYAAIANRALPVLTSLLASDADSLIRTRAGFLLENFGGAAEPALIAALDDPEFAVRRAAAMSLGRVGAARSLAPLLEEFAKPASRGLRREVETAIQDVVTHSSSGAAPVASAELSARIQRWIDDLEPEPGAGWPMRVCKEELNAYPLHSSLIYIWALRPDGTLLCMDHEAFGHPTEPETEPLVVFAALAQGARRHPELCELIPPPPAGTRPCDSCSGNGWMEDGSACLSCRSLGWCIP